MIYKVFFFFVLFNSVSNDIFSQYVVNGSAVSNSCNCYTITPAVNTQSGSVWNSNQINLTQPFDFKFDIFLGCKDGDGADGMAFVLQPISTTVGSSGGGMGFQGITPSLGVLLDTYQNSTDGDPTYDHISINRNGNIDHNAVANLAGPTQIINNVANAEDCAWHILRVTWEPASSTMTAYIDGVLRVQTTVNLINGIFNGNPMVFWGFTAATGGLNNEHRFCVKNTPTIQTNLTSDTICTQGSSFMFTGQGISNSSLPVAEHYWNMGDGTIYTTQNVSHTFAGTTPIYNIKYVSKTIDGCWSDTARKTLTMARYPTTSLNVNNTCINDTSFLTGALSQSPIDGTLTHFYTVDNINVTTFTGGMPYVVNLTAGTHIATYSTTTSYGCVSNIARDTFQVYPNPNNVTITANDGCQGAPINITSSTSDATLSYEWYINGNAAGTTSSISPTLTAGTYLIKHLVKNANGCKSDTATRSITIHPKPTANIIVNDTCLGNSTLFNSINTNASHNYFWIVNGNPINLNQASFIQAFPIGIHQVKHYIVGIGGCVSDTAYDTFEVFSKPPTPVATVYNLCQNQAANFNITAPNANALYYWIIDNAAPVQATTITNSFAAGNHTIKIIATNGSSCVSDTAIYNFMVTPIASAQFNVSDECGEKTITIQGGTAIQHQWFINGTLHNTNQNFSKLFTAGTYTIMHVANNGNTSCNDTVTKTFTVLAKPIISANAPTVCLGPPTQFTSVVNNAPIANVTYQWLLPNGSQSTVANPAITMNSAGNYQAILVVNNSTCASDTLRTNFIVTKPYVFAGNDTFVPRNQSFVLNGTADVGTYNWTPSSVFTNATTLSPTGQLTTTTYCILSVTANGCTATDSVLVTVFDEAKIYVPSVFTPNNDGVNDILQPIYFGIKELKFFKVYNRWGQLILEVKNNLTTGWNGSFQGKQQPVGTYVYVINAVDYLGKPVTVKGVTTIIK